MSPVHEHGYEPWEGERTSRWQRVFSIALEGLSRGVSSKWVWLLWAATAVHVAIRGGILYFSGQIDPEVAMGPQGDALGFTATFLGDALAFQAQWIVLILLVLVGTGTIARDKNADALTFYFSKPITRTGYAVGKIASPFAFALSVTFVPILLLWVLGVAFTPETLQPANLYGLPWRALAASAVVSLAASIVAVAISALVRSSNIAAASWVALALLSSAGGTTLASMTGNVDLETVDVLGAFTLAGEDLLGASIAGDPTGWAWIVTLGWCLVGVGAIASVLWGEEVTG